MDKKMLKKICKCGRMVKQGEECDCQKGRHKEYNKNQRSEMSRKFYQTVSWKKLREYVKARANGLDEYELYVNKRVVKGTIAHHIKEVSECAELKLTAENMIYVSARTHNMIHAEYDRSAKERARMQEKLKAIRRQHP